MTDSEPQLTFLRTSTRDRAALRERLERWLARTLGPGANPRVSALNSPAGAGLSSETLLFDVTWQADGRARSGSYVARLHPAPDSMPVFPVYDFDRQVRVMRLVAERSTVSVPPIVWYEPDPNPLGSPFFIMNRIDGIVAPDLMPYTCGSWLSEASLADQATVQHEAVAILAGIHGVAATPEELAFLEFDQPGATTLHRHFAHQQSYYQWVRGDWNCPVVDHTFAWLEAHWPAHEGEPVLCWGDARLGNVLWREFQAVAVLDWEMAARGPRELDLGWMIFFQIYFQDVAERFGKAGMPGFMRRDAAVAAYTKLTGYAPAEIDWFITYASLRQALVSIRTGRRSVYFGEQPMPADPQELIYHRNLMERVLDGRGDPWA